MKALTELIRSATGLDPESIGHGQLERSIRRRMEQTGEASLDSYRSLLQRRPEELQSLIELITVPETWFFRDPVAFDAIVARAKAHTAASPFRVLSIPCSTGEEPYSAAISLLEAGLAADRFRIDACDLCEKSIEEAKLGRYGRNSFRTGDLGLRERYFRRAPDGAQIDPAIRAQVRFRPANLLRFAAARLETRYEAILCRNLLIYFDAPTQQEAVAVLHRLLAPDGVLCVAPAEAALLLRGEFLPLTFTGAFTKRKSGRWPSVSGATKRKPRSSTSFAPPVLRPTPAKIAESKGSLADAIRLAAAGRYAEVAAICHELAAKGQASAEVYFLLAVVSEAEGDLPGAAQHYRKAIYLDPKHTEALQHFALLAARMGDDDVAEKLRDRAKRITQRINAA
jgi:chemotaxis protein methyltransferase WspC